MVSLVLIARGMLAHRPSLDLLDGLDLDFFSVRDNFGNDIDMNMLNDNRNDNDDLISYNNNNTNNNDNNYKNNNNINNNININIKKNKDDNKDHNVDISEYLDNDDFLFEQSFLQKSEIDGNDLDYDADMFKIDNNSNRSSRVESWGSQFRRSSLGGGSFDLTNLFFDGFGSNNNNDNHDSNNYDSHNNDINNNDILNNNYKNSVHRSKLQNNDNRNVNDILHGNGNGNGNENTTGGFSHSYGEVDLCAYKSMAASLQAQAETHQVRKVEMFSSSHGEIENERDRQTNRETDRYTHRQTDRQLDRQTDRQLDRHTDERQTDRQTDR